MRPQRTPCRRDPDEVFKPGDPVEVVADEPGLSGAHFAAVVVARSHSPHGYTVQYDALVEPGGSGRPLRKVVPARSLRPRPPPRWPSWQEPVEHEPVDTLLDETWWLGVGVCLGDADEYGKVRVCFPETRKVMEFDAADVRPHLEWAGGSWRQRSAFGMVAPENMPYTKGMQIEVSKLEDNSAVAWLPAVVVETFWKSNLLVEYTALKSNSTALPEEIVDVKHVRPCPPHASAFSFCINDEVEAFQGGGWWPGVITDVNPDLKYTFKSAHLGVEVQLSRKSLRPRYDWVYESQIAFKENIISPFKVEVSSNDKGFGGAWFEAAGGKGTAARRREKQLNNPSVGWKSTTPESGPPKAASMKKRKTRADGPPDLAPSLTKKHKSPKLRPSEENKRHESSSKEIYPDLHEKHTLRDAPCPDDQEKPAPQPEHTPAPATQPEHTPAPASQPELTPASAQRRKAILKLSLPMIHPAASPDATFSPPTREIDAEKNEAVQNTVMIPVTEAAKSLLTPLDAIIKDLKDCREQWLQAQSQLDHSATKAKEMEEQVAKLQAAREADAQHLREVMDKQTSLERRLELKDKEIEDLKKKLVDLDEQKSCVEAELPRGAVMAASHALGVLKNHLPDLDIGILGKGYACTPEEAQALADQARPMVEHFVECLGLSVSSASEDEV